MRKPKFIYHSLVLFFFVSCWHSTLVKAQDYDVQQVPYFHYGQGLGIASPDSMYLLNIRFRMQNRVALRSFSSNDLRIDEIDARVRRLRLRFDGFIYRPELTYIIQLSFSRWDQDFDVSGVPNVVRDAMVFYRVNERLMLGLGQTKLPGNRQRVNSSGDLQFPDRSIVNAFFNIDRDFGIQAFYNNHVSFMYFVLRGAISSGDGRNANVSDKGLAYTGRVELLPFGPFTFGGDYFEGDLMREPRPKVSVGLTYSINQLATRTGGQLGFALYEPRDIETRMADFLLKYQGLSISAEYMVRGTDEPLTANDLGDIRYVYVGAGANFQCSYLFKNDVELASRYSHLSPNRNIRQFERGVEQYTLGISKYLKGHRVKLQSDLTYEKTVWTSQFDQPDNWQLRFQIELGI